MNPVLEIDASAVRRNIDRIQTLLRSRKCRWRPRVLPGTPEQVLKEILNAVPGGFCVESMADAEPLIRSIQRYRSADHIPPDYIRPEELQAHDALFEVLINVLPASAEVAAEIVRLSTLFPAAAVIDHFRHAEYLSHAARRAGVSLRVLIDVDAGRGAVGVRPGHDASRLAEATALLPGLQVAGLMADDGHVQSLPPVQKLEAAAEIYRVLDHTRRLVQRIQPEPLILYAGRSGCLFNAATSSVINEVRSGRIIFGDEFVQTRCQAECSILEGIEPAITVLSIVISRPSLERAVVQGHPAFAASMMTLPRVLSTVGAIVTEAESSCVVLALNDASRDLQIGDSIRLTVPDAEWALISGDPIVGE